MSGYLETIKTALITFPLIAAVIAIPYLLWHYHKYGSLPLIRIVIVYSFILYLITAYYMVILPLPSREAVANMTNVSAQWIPFTFIADFMKELKEMSTYRFYEVPAFYTVFFNMCLCMPFAVYLRFYFKKSLGKTVFYTFLLSLFFELTQLSGLYFYYPRPYRLFDVDDLIINTLGAFPGYAVGMLFDKIFPSVDEVNQHALKKGQSVSFTRRLTSFVLDFMLYSILTTLVTVFIRVDGISVLTAIVYYWLIPMLCYGQTLANKFLNLTIVAEDKKLTWVHLALRQSLFYFGVFYLPPNLLQLGTRALGWMIEINLLISSLGVISLLFIYGLFYLLCFVTLVRRRPLFYDTLSRTRLMSTIEGSQDNGS